MKAKTAQNGETTSNSPVLTAREQEIFDLLLTGVIPKEIAAALNISYATVLDHQKNLYRKLEVHNINGLLVKFSKTKGIQAHRTDNSKAEGAAKKRRTVFIRWNTIKDDLDSHVNYSTVIEYIEDNYFETYTISGNVSVENYSYAGVFAFPDPSTHEAMRKAKRFSFTVLGDGNTYEVKIPTTEAKTDHNYYRKVFTTENGVIATFNFKMDELEPSPFGKKTPFVNNSIEGFLIQTYSPGSFNLKFWNIRFF